MPIHLDIYDEEVKGQVDECRMLLHRFIGQIDDRLVKYLMLKNDLKHFNGDVYLLREDLKVLRSIGPSSDLVTRCISEKDDAVRNYVRGDIPIITKKLRESTDEFARFLRLVEQLRAQLR